MKHPFTREESDPTDDLKSPLAGVSIPSAIVKIVVAIAIFWAMLDITIDDWRNAFFR